MKFDLHVLLSSWILITSIVGHITLVIMIIAIIKTLRYKHQETADEQEALSKLQEALKRTQFYEDVNKPMTDEEREQLQKTGKAGTTTTVKTTPEGEVKVETRPMIDDPEKVADLEKDK